MYYFLQNFDQIAKDINGNLNPVAFIHNYIWIYSFNKYSWNTFFNGTWWFTEALSNSWTIHWARGTGRVAGFRVRWYILFGYTESEDSAVAQVGMTNKLLEMQYRPGAQVIWALLLGHSVLVNATQALSCRS